MVEKIKRQGNPERIGGCFWQYKIVSFLQKNGLVLPHNKRLRIKRLRIKLPIKTGDSVTTAPNNNGKNKSSPPATENIQKKAKESKQPHKAFKGKCSNERNHLLSLWIGIFENFLGQYKNLFS